jgi:galactokinase
MPTLKQIVDSLRSDQGRLVLSRLYGSAPEILTGQTARYLSLLDQFSAAFPIHQQAELFSSPGRTEVGGNHTDHNAGHILAAAVDLDIVAVVARNNSDVIRFQSEGYPLSVVKLSELGVVDSEKYTATSLIRGVCSRFQQLGLSFGGFDAVATSRVPRGSGLSSSAAYEVLIAAILNTLFNQGKIGNVQLAQISQYAENQYFGKPCGLMDQTTCAVGGFVTIDFMDFENPLVKKVDYDFSASGYSLVIVDTAGDHADLNDEYEALEHEMKSVARAMGGQVLREFSEEEVLDQLDFLREKVSDRAILRAVHFYRDDKRVVEQVKTLEHKDFQRFLQLIIDSGESSWMLCQNCYSVKSIQKQGITIALTASEALLKGRGAWRVHGGGFAGTIQAFVPDDLLLIYLEKIERIFGKGSCHTIRVRPDGAIRVEI